MVARAIGPRAFRAIEPFRFDTPPVTRVSGTVDLQKKRYEDELHFEVSGRRFHWKNFHLDQLAGKVGWIGKMVSFSDLNGSWKTGRLMGDARFDFAAKEGADFSFKAVVAEADLAEVFAGFSAKTNEVEGLISGELVVTSANSSNRNSWQGHGRVNVRDGLLWDLPMFGIFSPILNAFAPGLGNSRARDASAIFIITNSVIHTENLGIHATGMRMQFNGTVGFDSRVDARVEAELLRDLPGIGLLLSKVLWPVTKVFEYKVTGTLRNPKAEPLYVFPKLLTLPFLPFRTLHDLMVVEEPATGPEPK